MNPCLLIPIYDHGSTIESVVESLAGFGLPCLIVDDGSGEATRAVLDELEARHAWVDVHHRKANGGRGAAVKTGYRIAASRGFSHAIQLDADGQHDADDVPRFLERIAANPEAVVLGVPVFDSSVPKSRLYGRQFSVGLVWLFTLSRSIPDPLCGFRAIPLAAVLRILDARESGDRMEFDPEILVRLFWAGVPVETVLTRVIYPEGGISHFDFWRDDLRMAGVYLRFFVEMVPRIPGLLARHWSRT